MWRQDTGLSLSVDPKIVCSTHYLRSQWSLRVIAGLQTTQASVASIVRSFSMNCDATFSCFQATVKKKQVRVLFPWQFEFQIQGVGTYFDKRVFLSARKHADRKVV